MVGLSMCCYQDGPRDAYMRHLLPEIKQWMDDVMLPRVNALAIESFGDLQNDKMYQLQLIAVHPVLHRRGLGAALCKHELDQVDAIDIPSCLETNSEDNIKFYSSLGFTVKDSVLMLSRLGDFIMTSMHRPVAANDAPR